MKKQNPKGRPSEKHRYSPEELEEFDKIILEKLALARNEFRFIQDSLTGRAENDAANLPSNTKPLEDGVEMMEREKFSQLATRQRRFIQQLEDARIRIKNGTYGICTATGKLISKERLRSVPHTTQSIEAKLNKDQEP